jgi:hypothetical protein
VIAAFVCLLLAPRNRFLPQMVEADRALNRTAHEKSMQVAFERASAPEFSIIGSDSIEHYKSAPAKSDTHPDWLIWEPTRAEISSDGTLGYTAGDWTSRRKEGFVEGNYLRIWVRNEKSWLVKLDVSTKTEIPQVPSGKIDYPKRPVGDKTQDDKAAQGEIVALETSPAYVADTYFLRPETVPLIADAPANPNPKPKKDATDCYVAKSADLAVTWGKLTDSGTDFAYLRVWRRIGKEWKVVAEYLDRADASTGSLG